MSVYGNPAADNAIAALLTDNARVSAERGGQFTSDTVTVQDGSTAYAFSRGVDRAWRLATVNTYGNVSFVRGAGCDASGFVINDHFVVEELNVCMADAR